MDQATRRRLRLQQLDEQVARIQAEKRRLKARASQEERKRETRRKILVGAMILDRVARGDWPAEQFQAALDRFLDRDQDRALFGLPPRQDREKGAPA